MSPGGPDGPVKPGIPAAPVNPVSPISPPGPTLPVTPVKPVAPFPPCKITKNTSYSNRLVIHILPTDSSQLIFTIKLLDDQMFILGCMVHILTRFCGKMTHFLNQPCIELCIFKVTECVMLHINKNLAIVNRSRVRCAHNTSRASIGLITPWLWNLN